MQPLHTKHWMDFISRRYFHRHGISLEYTLLVQGIQHCPILLLSNTKSMQESVPLPEKPTVIKDEKESLYFNPDFFNFNPILMDYVGLNLLGRL